MEGMDIEARLAGMTVDIDAQIAASEARAAEDVALGDTYVRAATDGDRHAFPAGATGRFNVFSLRDWLAAAALAGVAAVPARTVAELPARLPFRVLDDARTTPDEAAAWSALERTLAGLDPALGDVVRWDHCAGGDLKVASAEGRRPAADELGWRRLADGTAEPAIEDPRFVDLLFTWPQTTIPVHVRPWIEARRRAGADLRTGAPGLWPREWRAYVREGAVEGISNYYPQSPAEDGPETRAAAGEVLAKARAILAALEAAGLVPHAPAFDRMGAPAGIHCTLDFIEAADGRILLLEGGPPHTPGWGAHPCCFGPGEAFGLALAKGTVVPLP